MTTTKTTEPANTVLRIEASSSFSSGDGKQEMVQEGESLGGKWRYVRYAIDG